jgi:hypothetical protein
MFHGTQTDKISFNGNSIRVIDLKREIVDRKQMSGSLDFDLTVVDEGGKG